jgi:hypothetical protein
MIEERCCARLAEAGAVVLQAADHARRALHTQAAAAAAAAAINNVLSASHAAREMAGHNHQHPRNNETMFA